MAMKRNISNYLIKWKRELDTKEGLRKPLIVRGARQVGKTFTIEAFGKEEFSQVVKLNLDKDEDRALFRTVQDAAQFLKTLELKIRQKITVGKTLLFIDEIQNSENALKQLRYLYEEMPRLHVIAAGSLLDVIIRKNEFEIPVGRVEYCYMHPLSFDEFLRATNNEVLLETLDQVSIKNELTDSQHNICYKAFLEYILIGGMPEVVSNYNLGESPQGLDRVYESLMSGYRDDIGKYASPAQAVYLRHCLENIPRSVGMQISYNHFADSDFRSREISAAFDTLEFAQLVTRIFSSRSLAEPLVQNRKKAPKVAFLDVGLVNYKLGQRDKILSLSALENVFQGQISEQVVAQTLIAFGESTLQKLAYWYRDKKGSNAEIDYLISSEHGLIPLEVKAGSSQKIQSTYSFIDERFKTGINSKPIAVRIYSGKLSKTTLTTSSGNDFELVSIPYYLLFRIKEILRLI
jgi:predicted AAA+ superfamily ATPase